MKTCLQCGKEIEHDEIFYKVKDNFLCCKYFDGQDPIFCSQDCLCEYISADMEINTDNDSEEEDIQRILNEVNNETNRPDA